MVKAILFDLDGTLLPFDQDEFLKRYLALLGQELSQIPELSGIAPEKAVWAVVESTNAVVLNTDPDTTNAQVFFAGFKERTGADPKGIMKRLEAFYEEKFPGLGVHFPPDPKAAQAVQAAICGGKQCVLATTPLFPRAATLARMKWAGLRAQDFSLITTYEDMHAAKPQPAYYREVLNRCGLKPEECMMVGNDPADDFAATSPMGMHTFFLKGCERPYEGPKCWDREGGFDELIDHIRTL